MFSRIRLLCLRVIEGKGHGEGREGGGYLYIGNCPSWKKNGRE